MITNRRSFWQLFAATLQRSRRFPADQRGVTAIEFALLALPFFAFIGAVFETALIFLASQVLDSAVQDSARLIRTGQAHSESYNVESFRNAVCDELFGLFDCTKLKVKVQKLADFDSAALTSDIVDPDTGDWDITEGYSAGSGSSIVMVEVYYKWPTYLNILGFNLASLPDHTRLLGSVSIFRNEPF